MGREVKPSSSLRSSSAVRSWVWKNIKLPHTSSGYVLPNFCIQYQSNSYYAVYQGMVVQVVAKDKRSHLVAIIRGNLYHFSCTCKLTSVIVPEAEHQRSRSGLSSPWYLFNDFRVQDISEEEALSFSGAWKVPAVLYFERVDVRSHIDYSQLPTEVDLSILSQDTNISRSVFRYGL